MSNKLYNRVAPHLQRIAEDGGSSSNDISNLLLLQRSNEEYKDFLKVSFCPELHGYKSRTSGMYNYITKGYSINSTTDSTQTASASQPFLDKISPVEKLCAKNPANGMLYKVHNSISFLQTDKWTFECTILFNGAYNGRSGWFVNNIRNSSNSVIGCPSGIISIYNNLGVSKGGTKSIKQLFGKSIVLSLVANGDDTILIYVNGIYFDVISSFNSVFTFNTFLASYANEFDGNIYSYHVFSKSFSSAEVSTRYSILRSIFPEIPSVQIGTQTWAVRNYEGTVTPQGFIIPEIQSSTNTEKITNSNDRDFTTDTGFWSKDTGVTISGGVCHFNFPITGGGWLYKGGFLAGNKCYKVTFTVSNLTAGMLYFGFDNLNIPPISANGTYTIYVYNPNMMTPRFGTGGSSNICVCDLDNVSIQECGWSESQNVYDNIYAQTAEVAQSIEKITNSADRGFDSDTGFWTLDTGNSISGGVAQLRNTSPSTGIRKYNIVTPGKYYKITLTLSNITSSGITVLVGNNGKSFNSNGTYTFYIQCGTTHNHFYIQTAGSNQSCDIDNISIKELGITGNETSYMYPALKASAMWCHFNNDSSAGAIYGKNYNWYAAKLLQMDIDYYNAANPTARFGWHVPTEAEFATLATNLGGLTVAGGKLKIVGTTYWPLGNGNATNSSGFCQLGNTSRKSDGTWESPNYTYAGIANVSEASSTTYNVYYSRSSNEVLYVAAISKMNGIVIRLIKD